MRHLGLIALALTLVGCKDDAPSGDDSDAPPVDDTAPPEEECPPEEERTFYADGDGDGFGSPSSQVSACEAPRATSRPPGTVMTATAASPPAAWSSATPGTTTARASSMTA
ncbi:MAG: hypothetical protein IPN01_24970 [Deltaproteobacteria bacterium]|nr:hypothetical protein [Deltaproteobacteria bacterium]